jgi:hypothetical protein
MTARTIRRSARVAILAAALAAVAVSPAAAAAQTLAGEQFVSANHIEALTYEGQCNADGPSTFTYQSFGTATGPAPGDYLESGTFTLASPSGPVTAFDAEFTVYGGPEQIVGTKSLGSGGTASCSPNASGDLFDVDVQAQYTVTSPFSETGPVLVSLDGGWASGNLLATFGPQQPTGPQSKEDCMNGGYAAYGFPNQGQCIKAVNHG